MALAPGLLRKAELLEEKSAALYQAAAKRFEADLHWSRLFTRLAEEERQHALRIRMLGSRLRQVRGALKDASVQDGQIDELIAASDAVATRIASPDELSVSELLTTLRDLEERLDVVHAHMILASGDPGLVKFFEQMAAQDRAHAQLLAAELTTAKG